jgi:hypothetical protein
MKQRFFILLAMLAAYPLLSQDIIYTTGGNKYKAKVLENNSSDIKYKDFDNPEGPTYVISKREVVLIDYQNGTTEVINSNPPNYSSNKTETDYATKKPEQKNPNELYYMGKNMVSINALGLLNADISIFYDRDLLNNKLDLMLMGSYNLNKSKPALTTFINQDYPNAKKNFDVGLGLNFLPSDRGRAQYFVGVMAKYMQMEYDKSVITEQTINGFVFQSNSIERAPMSQLMIGATNGVQVRVSYHFNFKIFATLGLATNSPASTSSNAAGSTYPKAYLGYCFGYRF